MLQLSIEEEDIEMIKKDAKALGMTPGKYVTTVCGIMNDAARSLATEEFTTALTKSVMQGVAQAQQGK